MAIREEYKNLAVKDVDIMSVINFIENDIGVDFNVKEGTTINLRCPHEVFDIVSSEHTSSSITKTSLSLQRNNIKCYNPSCPANRPIDTIGLIDIFYSDLTFENKVKKILDIGGFEYEDDKKELSPEMKLAILKTNYVQEKCEQLIKGYEILEEGRLPKGRTETLYTDAAKYLLDRGIPKNLARKMRFGVGGGDSRILKDSPNHALKKTKIISDKNYEIMYNRILIPNISKGLVVGITGRAIYDNERRYLNVGFVQNLINIDNAKKHDRIFMFEGAFNGASYEVLSGKNNFITMQGASSFKKEFLQEIIKESAKFNENTEFIYIADNDNAGLYAAKQLGIEILKLGFLLNIVVTPADKNGDKIDLNDILMKHGTEEGKYMWEELLKTAEPFIVFAVKYEIKTLNGLNPLTLEIKKAKIIEKYLKLDFVDPMQRWALEQYFLSHGYPVTSEFFKYLDIKFSEEPKLSGDKLICFVGEINQTLKENLIEDGKQFNVLDISPKTNIYELDPSIEFVLITNSLYLFKTKKVYQLLTKLGHKVKIHYSDNPINSLIEYVFAVSRSVEGKKVFEELIK